MADGNVNINTTLNLDDFKKKLDEAKKKAEELGKPFDKVTKEIEKTETALAKAQKTFAETQEKLSPESVTRAFREQGAEAQKNLDILAKESHNAKIQVEDLSKTLDGLYQKRDVEIAGIEAAKEETRVAAEQLQARIEDEKRLAAEAALAKIQAEEKANNERIALAQRLKIGRAHV